MRCSRRSFTFGGVATLCLSGISPMEPFDGSILPRGCFFILDIDIENDATMGRVFRRYKAKNRAIRHDCMQAWLILPPA